IVVEPGQKFDPETDRVLFFGTAGRPFNVVFGPYPSFIMNGKEHPEPMNLKVGTRYRFRLFNLAGDMPLQVALTSGDKPVEWKAVAKDGYPIATMQQTMQPASLVFDPGEIYDYEITPSAPGELVLKFGARGLPGDRPPPPAGAPSNPPPTISVAVHVR